MNQQITDRQTGMFVAMGIVSLKLLILPAILSQYTIKYSYLSIILGLIVDFVFLMFTLWVIKKHPNFNFNQLIENVFGKASKHILNFILFIYFLIKGVLTVKETHNYFNETLFESISWLFFVIPIMMLMFYVIIKDLKTLARSVECFFLLIAAGVVLTFLLPISDVDFSNLLPLFGKGSEQTIVSLFYCNFSFGDYFVLFMLMGKIKLKQNSSKKILIYVLVTDLIVVLFYLVFVAMFGQIGVNQSLAISDLPLHALTSSAISRLDWIIIILWTIILIFQAGILFAMSSTCLLESLKLKSKYVAASVVILIVFAILYYFYLDLEGMINFVTSLPFAIVSAVVQVVYPVMVLIAGFVLKNKKIKLSNFVTGAQIKIQYTNISKVKKLKNNFSFNKNKVANVYDKVFEKV